MSTLAVRHAWLQMSSRKRKLDDDELTPRKRIQSLENTMADMSLIQARSTTASLAWSKPQSREGMLRVVARNSDVMEGLESTNEPETDAPVHVPHQDQDVRMTRQTWYEPEKDRIVITSLESDSEEESEQPKTPVLIVPDVVRRHLHTRQDQSTVSGTNAAAGQLVVYRPIIGLADPIIKEKLASSASVADDSGNLTSDVFASDDVMDIDS